MTINDPVAFCAGLWDWSILNGCFGDTKIKVSDIDGCIERNGKTLMFETKAPDVEIPFGQALMYKALAKTSTVMIVWGTKNDPVKLRIMYGDACRDYDPCDLELFREKVSRWYKWADKLKRSEPMSHSLNG